MTRSFSDLGEALLQDPVSNANNAAHLLAAVCPCGEAPAPVVGDAEATYRQWLLRQYTALLARLRGLIAGGALPIVQTRALSTLMDLVRAEWPGEFAAATFSPALEAVLRSRKAAPEVISAFLNKYLAYADVRYHTLKVLAKAAARSAAEAAASSDSDAAEQPEAGRQDMVSDADLARNVYDRRAWSGAWLALLRMPLPDDIFRKVLVRLHADVLPHLINPLLLTDFLTNALDRGGLNGMLALHGIFTLVTRHGLEYPRFYERLYQLLTPAAFQARQRARFFELADVFLSSGLVPAYTAAAFAKRFARLALTAPPAGALVSIAFVHNLLRRHPACGVLLHRPPRPAAPADPNPASCAPAGEADAAAGPGGGVDVYVEVAPDPALSRAIESSLWELDSLRNHYCPQVAAVVGVLDKDLADRKRTAEIDLAPLLPGSYASLANSELTRRMKRVPTAFYAEPPRRLLDVNCAADFAGWAI
ncbi:hypothetical protein WJX81_004282 [Elliptochloris bilobata]|uniref:CCAAT-binding factor domain-containing protein n=1 Tax=Elliptochloris bilobata TaxID=381761 RepID=A0AAW1RTF0_9CHLO